MKRWHKDRLEGGEMGEGKKKRKKRIYLDIRWHIFPPKVKENKHQALVLRLFHITGLCSLYRSIYSLLVFPAIFLLQTGENPEAINLAETGSARWDEYRDREQRGTPLRGSSEPEFLCSKGWGREGTSCDASACAFFYFGLQALGKVCLFFNFFSPPFQIDLIKQFLALCHCSMKELSKVPYGNNAFHYFALATHFLPGENQDISYNLLRPKWPDSRLSEKWSLPTRLIFTSAFK